MAIKHVIKLLNSLDSDIELRNRLYLCFDHTELMTFLNSKGYFFNGEDINNAVNMMHVQCQTIDEAQILMHKADWLRFLISESKK